MKGLKFKIKATINLDVVDIKDKIVISQIKDIIESKTTPISHNSGDIIQLNGLQFGSKLFNARVSVRYLEYVTDFNVNNEISGICHVNVCQVGGPYEE